LRKLGDVASSEPTRWRQNNLTRRLGVELPIVQAPLGGGPGTPELVAAASGAGALGVLACGYLDPVEVRTAVRRIRQLTDRPFAANVFLAARPHPGTSDLAAARRAVMDIAQALELPAEVPEEPRGLPDPQEQLAVLLDESVRIVSFTFGCPDSSVTARLRSAGVVSIATVGSAPEAERVVEAGVDVVWAQGNEAGGHRGGLSTHTEPPGLVALVPAVVDAVDVPVVAAGGIMDGRGVAAALALGAQAAALGTAFLRTAEAGTNPAYRRALVSADETSTLTTDAFSGRTARGLRNRYLEAFPPDTAIPPFPVMNYLTRGLRTASAQRGSADAQSLWAGQGVGRGRDISAADLVTQLTQEVEEALSRLR
jgi:nitronate monooxygenase